MGKLNVCMKFGDYKPPTTEALGKKIKAGPMSECLINVYATMDIAAGTELLCTYGPDYWKDK